MAFKMILFFTTKTQSLDGKIKEEVIDLSAIDDTQIEEQLPLIQSLFSNLVTNNITSLKFLPNQATEPNCTYPIQIEELFPLWLKNTNEGYSDLILFTKSYYDWLSCNSETDSLSFLNLEALIDTSNVPEKILKNKLFSYINSFPINEIKSKSGGIVETNKIRDLLDNVKVTLYTKKGTEESFKLILETLFDIDADLVNISYPKKYLMKLNGGRFEDMVFGSGKEEKQYSTNTNTFNPQLTGSILNYSIIQDNNIWQDYSYVLNIAGISSSVYQNVVRPLVHIAGSKDFFDLSQTVFNEIEENITPQISELTYVRNYAIYTLGSTMTIGYTFGCTSGFGGMTAPIYNFPTWDKEIYAQSLLVPGISFGSINIGDFLELTPIDGATIYPNENLICP